MRRLLFLLTSLGVALPLGAQVAAPPVTCAATAPSPRAVRAEGKAELVGDVVVTCTGGSPIGVDLVIPSVSFTLLFNSTIASKTLGPGVSEILALLDEPAPTAQFPCLESACVSFGNGLGSGYYGPTVFSTGAFGNPNIFQGNITSGNAVNFVLPFDPPGAGQTRVFRFTNIRLDATTAGNNPLRLVTISANQIPIPNGGGLTLATPQTGVAGNVRDGANGAAAPNGVSVTLSPSGASAVRAATLRFSTAFSGAAKPRTTASLTSLDAAPAPAAQNLPGQTYNSETGFYNPSLGTTTLGSDLAQAGLSNWGTRLMARFSNIPANVTIYVALRNEGAAVINAPAARLISTETNGAGAFSAIAGNGTYAQLTTVNGSAMAVWEVLGASGSASNWDFGVYLSYGAGIIAAPGPISVRMGVGPFTGGLPLFADTAAAQPFVSFALPPTPVSVVSAFPTSLAFTGTAGGQNPPAQPLGISSSPAGLAYGFAGSEGLSVAVQPPTGTTPGTSMVSIRTTGMPAGTYRDAITVFAGQASAQIPITLILTPGPVITSLSPPSTVAGSPAFTLTVSGANFTRGTTVNWNGSPLSTIVVSTSQMTAEVPPALVSKAGDASITAITADGAISNAAKFVIGSFTLTDISPRAVTAGGPAFTLTAAGTGFQAGAVVNVGGASIPASAVTSTSLTAPVPASAIAQPGTLSVTVTNPGGAVSNAVTLTVAEPLTLTAISPSTVTATAPAFVLTLTGGGFESGASAQVGASTLPAASSSRTQMSVNVPASAIGVAGALTVRVVNPNGQMSNSLTLTVSPAPVITSLSPAASAAGGAGFTLSVAGSNLTSGSTVRWNGQGLSTTYVSTTQLSAQVPPSLIASAGTASVSAATADGATSNSLTFTIQPPVSITSLSPATVNAGSGAFTLTVNGSNIPQGASVLWGGQSLSTSFVSASQLTAQVPAALVAAPVNAQVSVTTREGAVSNALTCRVVLPPLTNVGFTAPANAPSGQDQPITLTLGGTYPVDLRGTVTLTFAPDSTLPNDPAIQFQNGTRTFTFTVPAGAAAQVPPLVLKTGTVAGVITITAAFTTAAGENVTPGNIAPQRIQIGRAAPGISSMTCSRNATGFTVVIDGFTNTREATQATFDFAAAAGANLGTTQLIVQAGQLFTGWFGGGAAANAGGVFRYTQPFTVQGTSTAVTGVSARLANSAGTSASASCQLQ